MRNSATGEERRQIQLSFRVPADLAEALESVARQEDRTVSAELRRIIRLHVASATGALANGGAV